MAPPLAPRWLAQSSLEGLLVVRFDDVTQPEQVTLSSTKDGERVDPARVYWSPSGEHVAFVSEDSAGAASLWLASASDGFKRRAVTQPPSASEPLAAATWGPSPEQRALFWIGPNTFALRVESEAGVEFHRVGVESLVSELLGSYAHEPTELGRATDNVLSAASRFGFLFSAGSRSQAELLFAGETGAPRHLGRALSANGDGVHYSAAELVWAPDGESANFWTRAVSVDSGAVPAGLIAQFSVSDAQPPALEIEAGATPQIGLVHVPRGLYVDAHPHGNLTSSYEYGARTLAPQGAAVAYTLHHEHTTPNYQLVSTTWGGIEGGLGHAAPANFGFLDATRLFYSKFVPGSGSTTDDSVQCIVRTGEEARVISVDRYAPNYLAALPGSERLFFVRSDQAGRYQLHAVDLSEPSAQAEPVSLPGSVLRDSVLPQGHTWASAYGMQGGSDAGNALLVSTSTARDCSFTGHQCETQRFVVDLGQAVAVTELDSRWLYAPVNWAVDGSGLLAVDAQGLSFVPATGFHGSFPLSSDKGTVILPDRWPSP